MKKAKKAPKLPLKAKPATFEKPDPALSVKEEPGPDTGAPVHSDLDEKVRKADLERSVEKMAEESHHSAEALALAGLGMPSDANLVAEIAAVPAPGATGVVGWVTATKIEQVIKNRRK